MKSRIALAAVMALTFVGASWQLNPLVTRTAQPTGPVPAGCDESLAPAPTPRVIVAEIPEREVIVPVSMPAPPPSRSLREELDAAQRALERNNRPAFDEHLRAAREIVASYPAGGERSRAEEVVWALNDAAVLWDAQFQSPFFDETSDAYTRANRYAGFTEAVRRGVLTDDENRRFYPASESREFVARVAAERLERLGVRGTSSMPPTHTARAEMPAPRRTVSSVASSSVASSSAGSSSPSPSRRRTATRSHSPRRSSRTHQPSKPAALAKSAPSSSPDPSAAAPSPAPAEPAPTAPPASAPTSSATDSASAPASPVAEDVAPTPIATDSATTTAPPVTTTSSSPEPTPASSPAASERRSLIVPALLILIGLGVLIVLFRASK